MTIDRIRARAARKRSTLFLRHVEHLPRPVSVIDLGGSAQMWRRWGITASDGLRIVLANDHRADRTHRAEPLPGSFVENWLVDARELTPAQLAAYDVIFSNSMLEHLPTRAQQAALAEVIARSGRPYFIQVPNKHCIVDPHFPHPLAAFFAAWPRPMQAWVWQRHRLGSEGCPSSADDAIARVHGYNPLARRDLAALFPQARIVTEWNLGLPMSLIAIGGGAGR
jgi:hypothetical protein